MRIYAAVIACFLAGCATQQPMNADARCDKVAWYARSVATMRDVGIQKKDIDDQIPLRPQTLFYPQDVSDRVYLTKEKTPADIYVVFYAMCINNEFQRPTTEIHVMKGAPRVFADNGPTTSIPFEQPKVVYPESDAMVAHKQISKFSAEICYTNVESCK